MEGGHVKDGRVIKREGQIDQTTQRLKFISKSKDDVKLYQSKPIKILREQ